MLTKKSGNGGQKPYFAIYKINSEMHIYAKAEHEAIEPNRVKGAC
jgi:hypothetical protein